MPALRLPCPGRPCLLDRPGAPARAACGGPPGTPGPGGGRATGPAWAAGWAGAPSRV